MGALCSCCCRLVPSVEIAQQYGAWIPPSDDVAKANTKVFRSHHDTFSVSGTRTADMSEFGEGHTLYFYFLKWFSFIFAALFLITGLPSIVVNVLGNYYEDVGPEVVALGNLGPFHDLQAAAMITNATVGATDIEFEEATVSFFRNNDTGADPIHLLGSSSIKKEDALLAVSILDLIGALIYFAATLTVIRTQKHVARQVNVSTVTIADYSIRVTNLPRNAKSDEVREFFQRYGEVLMTELVKTDCELIAAAKEKKKAVEQFNQAKAVVQKKAMVNPEGSVWRRYVQQLPAWEQKVKNCLSHMEKFMSTRQQAEVVCAFVTLKEEDHKLAILDDYPNSFGRRLFMRKAKRFRGQYRLKIRQATEPTDIFWENLQFSAFYRFRRKAVTTFVKYMALLIGFLLVNIATSMKRGGNNLDQETCDSVCEYDEDLTIEEGTQKTYRSCWKSKSTYCSPPEKSCYACYCERVILNLGTELGTSEQTYCKDYFTSFALRTISQFVAVSAVVLINLTLTTLAVKLSRFERHHTRISEERSLAHKLFLSQFLNTVISYLVATTYVPRLRSFVEGTAVDGFLFVGVFVDTTPSWYQEVGRSLTITMITQCGVRLLRVGAKYLAFKWKFWWRSSALTQAQMDECYLGPEFDLAPRYGELLNLVFVTMLFGSGMPILYFVSAASFFLQYWAEKAELLKLSRRPSTYGPDLARMAANLLPWATLWHLAFSMWSFSFYKTARSPIVSEQSHKHVEWFLNLFYWIFSAKDGSEFDVKDCANRILQRNSAHHLVALIVVGICLILKITMSTWIAALRELAAFLGIIKDTEGDAAEATGYPAFSIAVRSRLLVGPTSYAIKTNPKYMYALANTRGWNTLERKPQPSSSPKIKSAPIPEASTLI